MTYGVSRGPAAEMLAALADVDVRIELSTAIFLGGRPSEPEMRLFARSKWGITDKRWRKVGPGPIFAADNRPKTRAELLRLLAQVLDTIDGTDDGTPPDQPPHPVS